MPAAAPTPARSAAPPPARRLRGEEAGYTLVELLLAATLSVIVLGAIVTFLLTSLQQSTDAAARADALDRGTFGMERLKQELRSALQLSPAVTVTTATDVVDARLWIRTAAGSKVQRWVRFDCGGAGTRTGTDACRRTDMSTGAVTLLVDGTSRTAPAVFTLRAPRAPAIVGQVDIELATAVPGATNPIVLRSAVTPRTCTDGPPTGSTTCPG